MTSITNPRDITVAQNAPFGDTAVTGTPSASPFHFTGRENDGTGLYYYRARYYDPLRGRFVSEDPIGLAGGINLLVYAGNKPIGKRDLLGLQEDIPQPGSVMPGTPGTSLPGNFPNPMQLFRDVGWLAVNMLALPELMNTAREAIDSYQRGMKCGTEQDVLICFYMQRPFASPPMVIPVAEPWLADRREYYCFGPFRAVGSCNSCPAIR